MRGRIKAVKDNYGFITTRKGVDFFFHRHDTKDFDELMIGDQVEFEMSYNDRGPRATDVVKVSKEEKDA